MSTRDSLPSNDMYCLAARAYWNAFRVRAETTTAQSKPQLLHAKLVMSSASPLVLTRHFSIR
jgi:hypothetical protein